MAAARTALSQARESAAHVDAFTKLVSDAEAAVGSATSSRDKAKAAEASAAPAARADATTATQTAEQTLAQKKADLLAAQGRLAQATAAASLEDNCETLVNHVCTEAARGTLSDPQFLDTNARACLKAKLSAQTAGSVEAVGAEIVRSVAQVVVTKAQAAGWQLLIDELKTKAQCGQTDTKFSQTCRVLGSLSIKDLVSSPDVLLSAVVADVLKAVSVPVFNEFGGKPVANVAGVALIEATLSWTQSRDRGLADAMRRSINAFVRDHASGHCDAAATTIPQKYGYVVGICTLQVGADALSKCDVSALIEECSGADNDVSAELARLWDLTLKALAKTAQPIDVVNLAFAVGRDQLNETQKGKDEAWKKASDEYFDGAKDVASGLATKDWVMATSGAVQILDTLGAELEAKQAAATAAKETANAAALGKQAKAYSTAIELIRVLAAIGNYALTFDKTTNLDPTAAAAAREKIITELVDRLVSRSERDGVVASVGGTLALSPAFRVGKQDGETKWTLASPVQLTLGVALQSYSKPTRTDSNNAGGLHLMFSALDLGNYVSMNGSGNLTVDTPELKSALAPGLALGYWFALRETPLHLAAQGSYAPFYGADGKPSFQAGLAVGIYVPLIDFN